MNFEQELKNKKLKITPQRMAILKEIEINGHICIEDLYEKIKKYHPYTSLATIYKNITVLCDYGVLCEVKIPGYKQRYELNTNKHIHVVCEKCGKLEDLYIDLYDFKQTCKSISGYDLKNLSAVFSGICPKCSQIKQNSISFDLKNDKERKSIFLG